MPAKLSPQDALIFTMVTISAADRTMSEAELSRIGSIVRQLPMFDDFTADLVDVAQDCGKVLSAEQGLTRVLAMIGEALGGTLRETAYMLALEVAAADLSVKDEEIRFLELLADTLALDRLTTAALERGAKARHQRIDA